MSEAGADDPVLLFSWRGCLFRVSDGVQPPKAGSLFFCRHLSTRPGERVLEIGAGRGADGWALLDRVIDGAPAHLERHGRVVFSIFEFLGLKAAHEKLERAGFTPRVLARETQSFPRIGYERLDHLRSIDREATLPAHGLPRTVERYIIEGIRHA